MKPSTFASKMLFLLALSTCHLHSNAQSKNNDKPIQSIYLNHREAAQEKNSLDARRLAKPAVIAEGIGIPSGIIKDTGRHSSGDIPLVLSEVSGELMQDTKPADQGISIPSVQGEGVGPATYISLSEKATESNAIKKGAAALSVSIYEAWWTDGFDAEGDGYVQSATLNWDADVIGGTGSLNVFIMLYYKPSASSSWTLLTTTATYTITDNSSSDAYHINLHNLSHGLYDWRIDIYQTEPTLFNGFYGPANDGDLNDYAMETAAEDVVPTALMYDAYWINQMDNDNDGYLQGGFFSWEENVSDGSSTLTVYEKVYWKYAESEIWNLLITTSVHSITGLRNFSSYGRLNGFNHNSYDFRIDIFQSGNTSPDDSYGPSDDAEFNNRLTEEDWQDVEPAGGIADAWWTNEVDADGDGYTQGARLNWDPYVNDGYSTLTVYENIYWKLPTSSSWNLLHTTSTHTITGNSGSDTYYVDPNTAFDHNLYDWRIDIFRLGESAEDDSYGPSDDSDLNDYPMEADWQDVEPAAYIYNVHWTNEVDVDGDGYFRSSSLIWNAEINDGYSPLNVNLDIYYKPSASGTWVAADAFAPHIVTGSTYLTYTTAFDGLDHNTYDFRIDIFQSGNTSADDTYMDFPAVNAYPMETAVQDVVGDATITGADSICQGATSTFSASSSDASSYLWELPTGWVIDSGQGTSSLVITAGSNSGNICVTPSNNAGSGTLTCHAVIVHALPGEANVSGSISVCTGSNVEYTAQASNADSYTWTVPSDWTINSGQGTSTISVTVGISSGNVCATPSNGWCNGAEGCVAATVFGIPDMPTITGEESVISGSTVSYSAVASKAKTYTWTVPPGWQIISGQGSDTIEVLAGDASSSICVTPMNDCGEGPVNCFQVSSNKLPGPVTISGPGLLCKELRGVYYADALDTDSYSWTLSGNWTIDSGQGSYSVMITPGDSIGILCVTPSNGTGEGSQECIQISLHTVPAQPSEILGETNPIINESYTYSVDLIPDAESYHWNTSDGSIDGETHEVDFIWNTIGHQGISVKTRNECGESELSILDVTVQESATGLAEVKGNDLLIYPNPSSDYLKIKGQYEQLNGSLVSLTDVSGKVVCVRKIELEISSNEFVMDISQMYPGIYIVSLQTNDLLVTKMLLIEIN